MSLQANPSVQPPVPAKKRGCFFYGCLTTIIVGIVLIVGIYVGIRYVISNAVDTYTQPTPMQLPTLDSSTDSYLKVKSKVEAFQAAIRQSQPASIELTGPEINTYLSSHPGLEGVTDNFRVSVTGSELQGILSIPLDQIGYADRYFNATMSIHVEMKAGNLSVQVRGLKLGNSSIPDNVISQMAGENVLDQVEPEKREKILELLAGVSSITVENGILRMSGGSGEKGATV